mmetsp:Transcript_18147/g.21406  ORF Transcript_18147/g.21406 Transcript_18147/m.21406 type:complete len:89 (-) Transcript_18147:213-479(-)
MLQQQLIDQKNDLIAKLRYKRDRSNVEPLEGLIDETHSEQGTSETFTVVAKRNRTNIGTKPHAVGQPQEEDDDDGEGKDSFGGFKLLK